MKDKRTRNIARNSQMGTGTGKQQHVASRSVNNPQLSLWPDALGSYIGFVIRL